MGGSVGGSGPLCTVPRSPNGSTLFLAACPVAGDQGKVISQGYLLLAAPSSTLGDGKQAENGTE